MSKLLTDKVAIITGAASGIGRATALVFAEYGAKLVIGDVDIDGGHETEQMVKDAGGEVLFTHIDVTKEQDQADFVQAAVDTYGRLDCAYNNAGIEGDQREIYELSTDEWARVIAVNLTGVWLGMRAQIPAMLETGGGAIVNTASVAGLAGFAKLSPYTASKHGVVGLTRALALEFADRNIRVNAVCPGVIRTPMVERAFADNPELEAALPMMEPIGRLGEPREIAEAVAWLCSDAASFVTGYPLAVDGGFMAK